LDIADGLKELLTSKGFTLKLLLDTPISGFASIIHDAVEKVVKDQQSGYRYHRGDTNVRSFADAADYHEPESTNMIKSLSEKSCCSVSNTSKMQNSY